MNNNQQNFLAKFAYDKKNYFSARYEVFAIVLFTLINMVMLLYGGGIYMLFSAYIPYQIVVMGMLMSGRIEGVDDIVIQTGDTALYVALTLAILVLAVYLILAVLSKKFYGCLIAVTILFGIDTLFLITSLGSGIIVDLVLHVVVMVMLVRGCASGKRYFEALKYLEYVQANGAFAENNTQTEMPPQSFENGYFTQNENDYFSDESGYNAPRNGENTNSDNKNDSDKDV